MKNARAETQTPGKARMHFPALPVYARKLFVYLAERGWFRWLPDKAYLKCFYYAKTGLRLHLDPPVLYGEKIQWLKLHDRDPLHRELTDKLGVRAYVEELIGGEYLIPLLGVWENPDEIDFASLPERFVLKCTHNSGGAIACKDKAVFDETRARKSLKRQLRQDYYEKGREWLYKGIPRCVVAEAYIGGEDGAPPADYKFSCYRGTPRVLLVCKNRAGKYADYYYMDRDFRFLPMMQGDEERASSVRLARPPHLDEMWKLAETLSQGMEHVRIDLYDTDAGVRFGEYTFFDTSGFYNGYTPLGERIMGEHLLKETTWQTNTSTKASRTNRRYSRTSKP